jgi:hypothetical protein
MSHILEFEQRMNMMRGYARSYDLHVLIESGSGYGTTPGGLIEDFDKIITIELDEGLYDHCRARFAPFAHVTCLHGNSGELLKHLVIDHQPILFWLDGHYSGDGTAKAADSDTPIVAELEAAVTAPKGSVILIDDARLFGGMPEHTEEFKGYPHYEWVAETAIKNDFDCDLKDDIFRLTPRV